MYFRESKVGELIVSTIKERGIEYHPPEDPDDPSRLDHVHLQYVMTQIVLTRRELIRTQPILKQEVARSKWGITYTLPVVLGILHQLREVSDDPLPVKGFHYRKAGLTTEVLDVVEASFLNPPLPPPLPPEPET